MAALQFVDVPGYSALLLRKTFADLNKSDSLIPRSEAWLGGTAAKWIAQKHTWEFPSGATLSFGYLDKTGDKYQYQSAAYQYIGWDELSHFRESDYRYMFSRLRKPDTMNVPVRMRSGSNPGGFGHEWVKRRMITEGPANGRRFIPAKLADNPHLNREEYIKSLSELDPITRQQLLDGNWEVRAGGTIFQAAWFKIVDLAPAEIRIWVRFWDCAATEPEEGEDPDWTAGCKMGQLEGQFFIGDIRRGQWNPKGVEDNVKQCAALDPTGTQIVKEQEPGASGKADIDNFARRIVTGYSFRGIPHHTNKLLRAGPLSSAAEAGNVFLVKGPWISAFLDEAEGFPGGQHDDQVDAASGAHTALTSGRRLFMA